jgi:DNA-binding GntR family transcriptional regulator
MIVTGPLVCANRIEYDPSDADRLGEGQMPKAKREVSELQARLARQLLEYIHENELKEGHHLIEEKLAAEFGVSRTPVRRALNHLAEAGVVEVVPNRGFFITATDREIGRAVKQISASEEEALYASILRDRAAGELGVQHTEADLMRRYSVRRGVLTRALWRLAKEGLLERSAGVGWSFLPSIDSVEAHYQSYRLRLLVEPAGLLEPTYVYDSRKIARCRAQHEALLNKGARAVKPNEMFEANAVFHETLAEMSGNRYFLQIVQQQNRLRRLRELHPLSPDRIKQSCEEHLAIMDALDGGDRELASFTLRRHLDEASRLVSSWSKAKEDEAA